MPQRCYEPVSEDSMRSSSKGAPGCAQGGDKMAKITTGSTFGLNARQATAARLMAEGHKLDTNFVQACGFDIRKEDNPAEVSEYKYLKARKVIYGWMRLPGFAECYRAIVREIVMPSYGRALNRIDQQIDDANPWIAQGAAREVLQRYGPAIMGEDDQTVTVKIEGMPEIGTPDGGG